MIEQTLPIVKTKKQGADESLPFEVTKAAHNAIRRSQLFDFLHAFAIAGLIWEVVALGYDSIEPDAHVEPRACFLQVVGEGR